MALMTYAEAAVLALTQEMQADANVVVLGEDVGRGGIFGQYKGLLERFGAQRIIDTPISEAAILGAGVGMALAGLLRAEAVLAVANGLFLFLIMFGGVIIPAASLPGPMSVVADLLPSGALVTGLTDSLVDGQMPSGLAVIVLIVWLASGALVSSRTFRWS